MAVSLVGECVTCNFNVLNTEIPGGPPDRLTTQINNKQYCFCYKFGPRRAGTLMGECVKFSVLTTVPPDGPPDKNE